MSENIKSYAPRIHYVTGKYDRRLESEMYTKDDLRAMLPKVGDILTKTPTFYCGEVSIETEKAAEHPCVVTFVNEDKLWYEVRFDFPAGSFKQCYKVPENVTWEEDAVYDIFDDFEEGE